MLRKDVVHFFHVLVHVPGVSTRTCLCYFGFPRQNVEQLALQHLLARLAIAVMSGLFSIHLHMIFVRNIAFYVLTIATPLLYTRLGVIRLCFRHKAAMSGCLLCSHVLRING